MDRTFLPDDVVDAVLHASADYVEALGTPVLDQIDAATRDLNEALPSAMVRAAEAGNQVIYAHLPEDVADRKHLVMPAARMLLAAMSTPPAWTCPHFTQIGPGVVLCDPPMFACMQPDCLDAMSTAESKAGHRWDQECDACGKHTDILWKNTRTIGPTYLVGHLCKACVEGGQLDVDVYGKDASRQVGRRQPCPCGSGRRYKACHGRAAA
jgi:hypothetical protein